MGFWKFLATTATVAFVDLVTGVEVGAHIQKQFIAQRAEAGPGPWPNCTAGVLPKQSNYDVVVARRDPLPNEGALISHVNGSSAFNFSFTTAWFPGVNGSDRGEGLIVRVVGTFCRTCGMLWH